MMSSRLKSKQFARLHVAAAAAAGFLLSAAAVHAGTGEVYDNWSSFDNGVTGAGAFASVGVPDTFIGSGLNLTSGTQYITGFDLFPINRTDAIATPTNTTFTAIEINIYLWGAVNAGTTSPTNPAFSDLLTPTPLSLAVGITGGLPPQYYVPFESSNPHVTPGITLNTPLKIPASTVGLTVEIEGTTQDLSSGNITFQPYNGLNCLVSGGSVAPTVGSDVQEGWYRNANGETNGNFTSTLRTAAAAGYTYAAIGTDVYGGTPSTYVWTTASDGVYSTATNWTPNGVPSSIDTAIFNLSGSGYTVEVPDSEAAGYFLVQNDNIQLDVDALSSYFYAANQLAVGLAPTAGGKATGVLTLVNTGGEQTNIVEAASIVVGGNGGTGSVSVTTGVYLYSDGDTSIGAGSNLSVGSLAKFGTGTLTIAGTTNAWTGQLDIGPSAVDIRNGSIGTVMNQLKTGYANGKWNGQGIISSAAAADTTHLTAVGAIVNNDGKGNPLYGSATALGEFDGESPPLNAVLIRYTYYGDANLDGKVDGSDYSAIDNGALNHLTGWQNGDFNYDGVINGSDYTLIDNAYNQQGGAIPFPFADSSNAIDAEHGSIADVLSSNGLSLSGSATPHHLDDISAVAATTTAEIAPVPEPTSLGLLALAAAPMLGRRWRRARRN